MTFQSAPDMAEAVVRFSLGGKQMVNVLGFLRSGGYIQADIDALAGVVDARVGTDYLPVCDASVTYTETLVRGLTLINDLQASNSASSGIGGSSGATLPANVTLCITMRSGFTGRSARGRFYAVPTNGTKLASVNTFAGAYGDALVDFLDGVALDAAALGWEHVIISRFTGNAQRAVAVPFIVNTNAYRNLTCDSQRGRLPSNH